MDKDNSESRPGALSPWARGFCIGLLVGLAVGLLLLLIYAVRRGGGAVLAAAAAPGLAASARSWAPKPPPVPRQPIDLEFVKARLRDFAQYWLQQKGAALLTPAELCMAMNHLLQKGQRTPFASPGHMALELTKLGLRSQVRTVAGRDERRWYDLSTYATPERTTGPA